MPYIRNAWQGPSLDIFNPRPMDNIIFIADKAAMTVAQHSVNLEYQEIPEIFLWHFGKFIVCLLSMNFIDDTIVLQN